MSTTRPHQLTLFEQKASPPAVLKVKIKAKKKPPTQSVAQEKTESRKIPSYLAGHRKRLRQRFLVGGAEPLPDYELLELLLFRCRSLGDVKPLAHALLQTFGDFNSVLAAPLERLQSVEGIGPETALDLKLIEAAGHRMTQTKLRRRHAISNWSVLLDYCRSTMAHRELEQFRIFYLDRKNVLISDEMQAKGTVDHVPVYPREVIKRALELNASALILVHNHPSGDPTPSQADIQMTEDIIKACDAVGLTVHDHLIIGKSRETSFRSDGLLG